MHIFKFWKQNKIFTIKKRIIHKKKSIIICVNYFVPAFDEGIWGQRRREGWWRSGLTLACNWKGWEANDSDERWGWQNKNGRKQNTDCGLWLMAIYMEVVEGRQWVEMGNGFWSQHRWTKEERSRQEVALPIGHEHGEDEERNLKKENGFFLILKIKLMTISFFFL